MTSTTTETISLRALYGCCGTSGDDRCECWCHDPSEGATNVHVDDYAKPEVRQVCKQIAETGGPWRGRVEWVTV